jgi:hypothetical protein
MLKGQSHEIFDPQFFSSNLIEYIREFESICKTVLAHEPGVPGVQLIEKTVGRKSRETVPLKFQVGIFSVEWKMAASTESKELFMFAGYTSREKLQEREEIVRR